MELEVVLEGEPDVGREPTRAKWIEGMRLHGFAPAGFEQARLRGHRRADALTPGIVSER